MRVDVWNGDISEYLGQGYYDKNVTVYFTKQMVTNDDGEPHLTLRSLENAEEKPEGLPEDEILSIEDCPKIELDSGRIVYGCQVWWEKAKDAEVEEDEDGQT